jgi:nucleoside-diphosphate-sugar epimerase
MASHITPKLLVQPKYLSRGQSVDHQTFINNISCTWNVFSAARRADMINIAWASSETVLGRPFETAPPYIPVDEAYSPRPESTYLLVKTLEARWSRKGEKCLT